jgi:glutamate-1-semialdehyde 2,1-aminomutase
MEVERLVPPENHFPKVKELCHKNGALLIFVRSSQVSAGTGGAQKCHNIVPVIYVRKAMGNGFSISALVGKRDIMELGGLRHNKEKYFYSTTFGARLIHLPQRWHDEDLQKRTSDPLYQRGRLIKGLINLSRRTTSMGTLALLGKRAIFFLYQG